MLQKFGIDGPGDSCRLRWSRSGISLSAARQSRGQPGDLAQERLAVSVIKAPAGLHCAPAKKKKKKKEEEKKRKIKRRAACATPTAPTAAASPTWGSNPRPQG